MTKVLLPLLLLDIVRTAHNSFYPDKDRLHQQHWMIKLAFGGNFSSPVEEQLQKGITVLDSACGTLLRAASRC